MPIEAPTWDATQALPTWDDTSEDNPTYGFGAPETPMGADGLPAGLPARERKRLDLASEMAAARGEGEALATRERRMDLALAPVEGALTALSMSPSAIAQTVERGVPATVATVRGEESFTPLPPLVSGNLNPGEQRAIQIPHITTDTNTPAMLQVGAGVANAAIEFANIFTTPEGIMTLGIGGLPSAMQKRVIGVMGANLAANYPEEFNAAMEAASAGDYNTAAQRIVATPVMSTLMARGAVDMPKLPGMPLPERASPDLVARNTAAPGTVRPTEQRMMAAPEVTPPAEMVSIGEMPFARAQRFGAVRELVPKWEETAEPQVGGGESGKVVARREELGAGGRLGFARTAEDFIGKDRAETKAESGKVGAGESGREVPPPIEDLPPATEITGSKVRKGTEMPAEVGESPIPEAPRSKTVRELPEVPALPEPMAGQPYEPMAKGMKAKAAPEVKAESGKVGAGESGQGAAVAEATIRENLIVEQPPAAQAPMRERGRAPEVKAESGKVAPGGGGVPYYRKLGGQDAVDPARKRMRAVPQNYKLAYIDGWYAAKKGAKGSTPAAVEPANPVGLVNPVEKSVAKVAEHVEAVAKGKKKAAPEPALEHTTGPRAAKEIKSELVQRLEEAIAKAPDIDYSQFIIPKVQRWEVLSNGKRKAYDTKDVPLSAILSDPARWKVVQSDINGWRQMANRSLADGTITIEIPGDGTFKIPNSKPGVEEVLNRARGLETSAKPPKGYTESLPTREQGKLWLREAEAWADGKIAEGQKLGITPGKPDPALLAAYVVKGAAMVERGARKFADWAQAMLREHGDGVRPYLREIWDEVQRTSAGVAADVAEGQKLRKSAASGMTSPLVPKVQQERLATDPAARYTPQDMGRVEDAVGRMSDAELQSMPLVQPDGPSNAGVAARLELYKRRVAEGQLDAAWGIFDDLMRAGTSMGQLINQFKMLQGATPDGVLVAVNKRLLANGFDPMRPSEMIRIRRIAQESIEANEKWKQAEQEFVNTRSDPAFETAVTARETAIVKDLELQQRLRKFNPKSFWDVLGTIMQGNLMAPTSLIANVFGNTNNLLARGAGRALGAAVDTVDAYLRNVPREQTTVPLRGTSNAVRAAVRSAPDMLNTLYRGASDLELSKVDAKVGLQPLVALRNLMVEEARRQLPTKKGKLTLEQRATLALEASPFAVAAAAMLRTLAATDLPSRNAARARLITEAMKLRMLNSGEKFTPQQVRQAVQFPEAFLDKAELARIDAETLKAVYQNQNKASGWILHGMNQARPFTRFIVRSIVPYVTTPTNVLAEALSYVPLVAEANMVRHIVGKRKRAAEQAAGKAIVGTVATMAGVWLYNRGLVGPALDDRDEANKGRTLANSVLPPNHLNISGLERALSGGDPQWLPGDRTVDIMRGGGVAAMLMLNAANTLRRQEITPDDGSGPTLEILRDGVANTLGYSVNQSYTKGIASALDALRGEQLDKWFMNYADGLGAIVAPNSIKSFARATREYKPEIMNDATLKTLENVVRAKVGDTEGLPLKRGLWGEPLRETPEGANPWLYNLLDITKARRIPKDPVALEIYRLWRQTGDKEVVPTPADSTMTLGNRTYKLDKAMTSRRQELVGQWRRSIVERVLQADDWPQITTQQQMTRLKRAYARGAEIGNARFFTENREMLEQAPKPRGFQVLRPTSQPTPRATP